MVFSVSCYTQPRKSAYTLTITKGKLLQDNGENLLIVPVTLTNNSNTVLYYYSMSCSWQGFYSTNNKALEVATMSCDKNVPTILALPAGASKTMELELIIHGKRTGKNEFSIGLNIIEATKENGNTDLSKLLQQKNITWSNKMVF